jgi:histidine triad (HIT) family protein
MNEKDKIKNNKHNFNTMTKTIFEKIISREIPSTIIYEDDLTIAFLDAFPFERGHILVVPKKPYAQI